MKSNNKILTFSMAAVLIVSLIASTNFGNQISFAQEKIFFTSSAGNSYAQENEKTQNLTETNIPKVLPLVRGFADGNEVFYITTEVSDEKLANYLSNLTNSRVVYTPALKYAPVQSLANIYEFTNGIKGNGPEG